MGLFSRLLGRVFGSKASAPSTSGADAYAARQQASQDGKTSPYQNQQAPKRGLWDAKADAAAKWKSVSSSNVKEIRWLPGGALFAQIEKPNPRSPIGPQGGAAVGGGAKYRDEARHMRDIPAELEIKGPITLTTLGTLEVKFRQSWEYHYFNVPFSIYIRFDEAGSKGKFVWRYLRGVFEYRRVR